MSLGAIPGTGPATSPLPVIRPVKVPRTFADLPTGRVDHPSPEALDDRLAHAAVLVHL